MATPVIYSRYSAAGRFFWAMHRRKLLVAIVAIAFMPAILERGFSSGPAPGRALFVFMLVYFAALMPFVAFPKELPARPWSVGVTSWAWARALVCTAWACACIWVIYDAFHGKAV